MIFYKFLYYNLYEFCGQIWYLLKKFDKRFFRFGVNHTLSRTNLKNEPKIENRTWKPKYLRNWKPKNRVSICTHLGFLFLKKCGLGELVKFTGKSMLIEEDQKIHIWPENSYLVGNNTRNRYNRLYPIIDIFWTINFNGLHVNIPKSYIL